MMKGLSGAGMTGLAMLPESLRHPFGTEAAPLGADDYQGATIRSLHSTTTWDVLGALGAAPMFEDDGYTIAESQYDQAPGPEGTGNVTLFAKADVIVISDAARPKVSGSQLDALTEAAETTRDWAIGTFSTMPRPPRGTATTAGRSSPPATPTSLDSARGGAGDRRPQEGCRHRRDHHRDRGAEGEITARPVTELPGAVGASKASLLNGTYRWEVARKALHGRRRHRSPRRSTTCPDPDGDHGGRRHVTSRTRARKDRTRAIPTRGASPTSSTAMLTIHWSQSQTNCTSAKVTMLEDGDLEFSDIVECAEDEVGSPARPGRVPPLGEDR